jgi:arylsulfatase A-like enzyme
MNFLYKIKYVIIILAAGFILFWAISYLNDSKDYIESEYFIGYFPFAQKGSAFDTADLSFKKFKLERLNITSTSATVIRLPINCHLDYYMKIPRESLLKIQVKHYGRKKLKALEEFKINIQEVNRPAQLLYSIKFKKGLIKNHWRSKEVSLKQYGDKIVRISFHSARYAGVSKAPEGFLFRPVLMIKKELLHSQKEKYKSLSLNINSEKLRKTNVIIIVLDAARPDHFSCYGYHRKTTPYIDQYAEESVIFRNAFSAASYTVPSTTSLFTSLYPDTHRVLTWEQRIPDNILTLADVLAKEGYSTFASGFIIKWARKGFQKTFDLFIHTEQDFNNSLHHFLSEHFSEKEQSPPKFIYIHLRPPHSDYDPPERFDKWSDKILGARYAELTSSNALMNLDKGKRLISQEELQFIIDRYDGNLLWGDWLVHLILESFKEYKIYNDSLIILTSDHGEAFLEHGKLLHNSTVYNEMIKIPLIIKFPSYIKPKKKKIKAYVDNIDIMPSILDLLTIEDLKLKLQGQSFLPLIFGNTIKGRSYLFARPVFDWIFSITDSHYKYIQIAKRGELYNLKNDPQEKVDLSSKQPILYGYYRSLAAFYRSQLIADRSEEPIEIKLDEETIAKLRSLGYLQ